MRKLSLILAVAAVACVAANQADAGGVISYQKALHAAVVPAVIQAGHHAAVQQVAHGHRPHHRNQYARYYGHGHGRPNYGHRYGRPPVYGHPPVYRHPRVVVPYAYPYYAPYRGFSYHAPGLSIGIGF